MEVFTYAGFMALLQVIGIDLVLAGDNAIVIGLAAAGLPKRATLKGYSCRYSGGDNPADRLCLDYHETAGDCGLAVGGRGVAALGLLENVAG